MARPVFTKMRNTDLPEQFQQPALNALAQQKANETRIPAIAFVATIAPICSHCNIARLAKLRSSCNRQPCRIAKQYEAWLKRQPDNNHCVHPMLMDETRFEALVRELEPRYSGNPTTDFVRSMVAHGQPAHTQVFYLDEDDGTMGPHLSQRQLPQEDRITP